MAAAEAARTLTPRKWSPHGRAEAARKRAGVVTAEAAQGVVVVTAQMRGSSKESSPKQRGRFGRGVGRALPPPP